MCYPAFKCDYCLIMDAVSGFGNPTDPWYRKICGKCLSKVMDNVLGIPLSYQEIVSTNSEREVE